MILSYILSIFIFLGSAFMLADLFIDSNKKYQSEIQSFIKETKEKADLYNQNGFGTLMGITLLFLFSSMFYFFLLKFQIERNELLYRKNLYLCFHRYQSITKEYVSFIAKTNATILALSASEISGVTVAHAETIILGIIKAQDLFLISTMKKTASISWCSLSERITLMQNLPYEKNLSGHIRTLDRTVHIGEEKWTLTIGHVQKNTRLKNLFHLEIDGELTSNLSTQPHFQIKETILSDSSSLKPPSGSALSYLSH